MILNAENVKCIHFVYIIVYIIYTAMYTLCTFSCIHFVCITSVRVLSKKMFSFKINKLSTTDNILDGKPCDILYTGYLNKDISFGDIVYFEPNNVQYKTLVIGTINQLKVSFVNGDGSEILSNFKISIVLHIV